tara:strand:- start:2465 stop:3466 length:1002 start_codon:yes stop_codon:yes gene_type:complete
MSIIERAVDKLTKNADTSTKRRGDGDVANGLDFPVGENVERDGNRIAEEASHSGETGDIADSERVRSGAPANVLEIPFAHLHSLGMVTHIAPRSEIAESYRIIKRPLLMNMAREDASDTVNLIMVTSALQGEGKTFSAINLAMSIAMEQDKTVLFVDADIAKATAGTLLGVSHDANGLIDVLENDDIDVGDVILPTNIRNLRVIPAGHIHERSTELLASDNMRLIMRELCQRYPDRVVVFDSPPLLLASEASVLANLMGQIVFVVAADETPQHAVTEALQRIGGDKIIGTVLNKTRSNPFNKSVYGYGYGYGYGHEGRYRSTRIEGDLGQEGR